MNKTYMGFVMAAGLLALGACSDTYDIYPEQYASVLQIKDAGAHDLTVYSTDTKTPFQITVTKGGTSDKAAKATLRVMTDQEFADYLTEAGAPYSMLPAEYYSFSPDGQTNSLDISFGADEAYKVVDVYINSQAFGEYSDEYDWSLYRPVLPIVMESSDASINGYGVETFVLPTFVEPGLSLVQNDMISLDDDYVTMTFDVSLPIENMWDINLKLELDPGYVDLYNEWYWKHYEAVDPSAVKGLDGTFTMPKGSSTATVQLTVDRSKLRSCDEVVPVRLAGCDVPGIVVNEGYDHVMAQVRKPIPLTADMFSTNALEPSEGSLANLLDGDVNSFFHSAWSVGVDGYHWLQVTLPQKYNMVQLEWCNRNSGTTNTPAWFNLYAGTSEDNLTMVRQDDYAYDCINGNIPAGWNTLRTLQLTGPANIFRIENTWSWNSQYFFVMSEFRMYTL